MNPIEMDGKRMIDPWMELALAILQNACDEAGGHFSEHIFRKAERNARKNAARAWLLSDDCAMICEVLEIDCLDYIREKLAIHTEEGYENMTLFELEGAAV